MIKFSIYQIMKFNVLKNLIYLISLNIKTLLIFIGDIVKYLNGEI